VRGRVDQLNQRRNDTRAFGSAHEEKQADQQWEQRPGDLANYAAKLPAGDEAVERHQQQRTKYGNDAQWQTGGRGNDVDSGQRTNSSQAGSRPGRKPI
jgi:hypothetical protein